MNDERLRHHGVKGMKWGVRRYQPHSKSSNKKGTKKKSKSNKTTGQKVKKAAAIIGTAFVARNLLMSAAYFSTKTSTSTINAGRQVVDRWYDVSSL